MSPAVLVLNCGSSSLKFALFEAGTQPPPRQPLWSGQVSGIASGRGWWCEAGQARQPLARDGEAPAHAALEHIRRRVLAHPRAQGLAAVAHRVVHGGSRHTAPVRVDAALLAELRDYIPLAPLHQPFALAAIEALLAVHPGLPQVACFDTAFHHTLPLTEQLLPLPWAQWERGVRRYGFHGLSYEYLSLALAERHGDAARGRTLVAHLGSGASLCAMRDLQSAATSMGFSALDGLMMGTRCGALDPGAVLHLMETERLTLEEVGRMLYHGSGLLGVSGVSADVRDLLALEAAHPRAAAALALYVRSIVREIGALVATLGGLDMLVFTAGVGEHNAVVRERVCARLDWLGAELDATANTGHEAVISTPASRVRLCVEPTHEEWVAARHAQRLLAG